MESTSAHYIDSMCMVGLIMIDRCVAERRFVSRPHGSPVPLSVVIVLASRSLQPRLAMYSNRNEVTAARVEEAKTIT